jgi:hypothetical protein
MDSRSEHWLIKAAIFFIAISVKTSFAASIQAQESTLSILTDKTGLASGLAHRHIITASKWSGTIQLNNAAGAKGNGFGELISGDATITIPVKDLIVDSPEASQGIIGVFTTAGHWSAASDKLEPANAEKIRVNMLDESQLAAEKFPTIEGVGKFSGCAVNGALTTCQLQLVLKIHGQSVTKTVPVTMTQSGGRIAAQIFVPLRFSEFGIKAYTAMLGAIAVKDEFFLGANLLATEP